MPEIEILPELNFLSELYVQDSPSAQLLAEYPSSNSTDTIFQNKTQYIIHDPFPPPPAELLKVLGPHHLMCGWGSHLSVTSQISPPEMLTDHWVRLFGDAAKPQWRPYSDQVDYITLFPHQSVPAERQVLDPDINYALHSKEVIEKIECPQAKVLGAITPPCIVKLSHGYAGLGNFLIESSEDEAKMRHQLEGQWPNATYVINSVIENICGDYGVQFYLRKDGSMVWLGLTEQHFDKNKRWCGGTFSAHLQQDLFDDLVKIVEPTGDYLHSCGYFGLVGIDILKDTTDGHFLVDVNPRLTGVSPFLIAARIFSRDDGLNEGIYQASVRFNGRFEQLIEAVEKETEARVVVVSAFEDISEPNAPVTTCHLSATSDSQDCNQRVLTKILAS